MSPDRPRDRTTEERVLVLAPVGRDARLACEVLAEAGMAAEACADGDALQRLAADGMGALILTEEAAVAETLESVARTVAAQPPWSDLPVILFASSDPATITGGELIERLRPLANVTVLERPLHRATLVSAVQSALRARRRQYQVRDLLDALERGVRTRDEFLAMLGHELRNPLGALRNTLYLIDLEQGGTAPTARVEVEPRHLALVSRQVAHLARLVDDLLDVSRVTSGKIALRRQPVDLVELVLRCVHSLENAARGHGLGFDLAAGSQSLVVDGDPTRLEQVMTNLLTNAVKYTPAQGQIRVSLRREGAEAVVTVSDTGAGLAAELLERVFDLFSQADRTLERAQGGLGIGLTLVRAIVRLHGGEVSARSPGPGLGSTFEVRLPLSGTPVGAASPPARTRRQSRSGPLRMLVVEDNADNRDSLVHLLQHLGHEVTAAEDGARALDLLARERYDLAFVDIGLPGITGYEVARRARSLGGGGTYLIALTGYGLPEDRERAQAAGFDDHVAKPLDLERLDDLLARMAAPRR